MEALDRTLYLKLNEMSEVQEADVYLKDVAQLYCDDEAVLRRCRELKLYALDPERERRYVKNVLSVIQKIHEMDPEIPVTSLGGSDFVISFRKKRPPRLWLQRLKAAFVCLISFCGAAFAIMTFNNDVGVGEVFGRMYQLVMGTESDGYTILEISYSIGLAVGILIFFNHFSVWKLNTDPTPLEVEMRMYEDNISKTLIQNAGRKESGTDVD